MKANPILIAAAAPQMWDIVETIAQMIDDGAPAALILDDHSLVLEAILDVVAKVKRAAP